MANKEYDFSIDDYSACDVFDAMNECVDWTKDQFITGVVYDLVEGSVKEEVITATSQLRRLYMHMLKYKYQSNKQTKSWINTIRNASTELNDIISPRKNVRNRITNDIMDRCYSQARNDAEDETGLVISTFPKERPFNWTVDNVRDERYISEFLKNWAYTSDAKKRCADIYREEQ